MEKIENVWFEHERIYIRTASGEVRSRPLEAFPALKDATDSERKAYTIEMRGEALRWAAIDEDIHISSFYENSEPQPVNEVAEMFSRFPWLNVSEVAREMGIHKSLLARYIYGIKKPAPERVEQIRHTLHLMGEALMAV